MHGVFEGNRESPDRISRIKSSRIAMITIETIVNKLNSVPETLLIEVLSFIRDTKSKSAQISKPSDFQRIAGLHEGQILISDDFNDSLPDEFWLGNE